jgi:hypothetical protein
MGAISTIGFEPSATLQGSRLAGQGRPRLEGHRKPNCPDFHYAEKAWQPKEYGIGPFKEQGAKCL